MVDVTNELIYEVLKGLQEGQKDMKAQLHGIREEVGALRTHMLGVQADVSNLYSGQVELVKDVGRIKALLNLTEVPQ